jgi:hypothetical protein
MESSEFCGIGASEGRSIGPPQAFQSQPTVRDPDHDPGSDQQGNR